MLAEGSTELGGRVLRESSLPGLGTWIRVRDYRQHMISKLANAEVYRGSMLTAEDIAGLEVKHAVLATGSRWRRDGRGAVNQDAVEIASALTPDEVFAGATISGPVVIYDDEHYFMGGGLAEKLKLAGHNVRLVTTMPVASSWTTCTDEQFFVQKRLMELGVDLTLSHIIAGWEHDSLRLACSYTGKSLTLACQTLIMVTGRIPDDALYQELSRHEDNGLETLARIGDCLAPGLIADAVYGGHRFARSFGEPRSTVPLRRERP